MSNSKTRWNQPAGRTSLLAASLLAAGALLAACSSSAAKPHSAPAPVPKKGTTTTTTVAVSSSQCVSKATSAKSKKATMTVTPGTCLKNGQVVKVTGTGFAAGSYGGLAECSSSNSQPTVPLAGNKVPVSCSDPLSRTATTSASGKLNATFVVKTGVIGPPAKATDSAGHSAAVDARSYPCPPTAKQKAAGLTCGISFGDAAGNQVTVPISFAAGS